MNLSLKKEKEEQLKLVVRLPNWIGDALMAFPMLLALQKKGIDFVCVGHPWAKELFSETNFKVITSPQIKSSKWCYNFYKKNNFNYGLLCTRTLSTVVPMRLAGLKTVGYHLFSNVRLNYNDSLHTVENYFDLANYFIKDEFKLNDLTDKVPISKKNEEIAKKIIQEKINSKYIVVCPYATNLHKGKNKEWPYWQKFCRKYNKYKIVSLVSQSDLKRCKLEYPEIIVMSCALPVTAYMMNNAEFVLANDSGAMHIASFFGANIIGLFGATEIQKTRPWYGNYLVGEKGEFVEINQLTSEINNLI